MKEGVCYYPAPADAVTLDKELHTLQSLSPKPSPAWVKTSAPTPMLLLEEQEPQKGEEGLWLSEEELRKYLKGESATGTPGSELFVREPRFGIEMDKKQRVTAEGLLYQAEFIRPQERVGLWLEVEGLNGWPGEGLLHVGGESRGGYYKQLPPEIPRPSLARGGGEQLSPRFKLYFATPTYFQGGWQPKDGDDGDWNQYFKGGRVTLQAAAVGRYLSMGGYDWAKKWHKPAYRYVPAGSVYYFEAEGQVTLKEDWVCDPISQPDSTAVPIGRIGFGQVIVADW
jgi:CRISPR-associated protein Cmr3